MSGNLPLIQVAPTLHSSIRENQNYLMTPKERGILVTLLRQLKAQTVVEIGINEGLCAEIMLKAVPSIPLCRRGCRAGLHHQHENAATGNTGSARQVRAWG